MSGGEHDAIYAEARRVKILDVIQRFIGAVTWRRNGDWLRARCPLCGAGRKGSLPFAVNPRKGTWFCHAESEGGDTVEIVKDSRGVSRLEAARLITGWTPSSPAPSPSPRAAEADAQAEAEEAARAERRAKFIADLTARQWREALPAAGSPVEAWFKSRGLRPAFIDGAFERLRFHPEALAAAGRDEHGRKWEVRAPAMLAEVTAWRGKLGAFRVTAQHCTYLRGSGAAKARLFTPDGAALPARKIWGEYVGGAVWLTDPQAARDMPLATGEGIETVWAYAQLSGAARHRYAASLSLDNFCGRPLRDAGGCFDPAAPRRDAGRACFTVPDAGAVIGLVDRDMSPVEIRTRDRFRKRIKRELTQDERARIAASLFKQQWLAAGASEAGVAFPPPGMDFNDAWIAGQA